MSTEPNEDTERSDNDTPCNEPQEQDTATEKRYRRKSVRRQLQDVVTKLGKVAEEQHQKPAKKADALIRQSEVLMKLQEMDAEDKQSSIAEENAQLQERHAADVAHISELESHTEELRRAANRVTTVIVPDPEAQRLRANNTRLQRTIDFTVKQIANPEMTAIRAIREVPESADMICAGLGINHDEYRRYLMTYTREQDLLKVLEQAQVTDTPLLRFCRAALSVIHGTNIFGPRRRESVPMDPVIAAKYLTGTLKPVDDDF
ncbi:MAG: hypothetical protein WCA76_03780 [Candidatus Sulfotelmatobacter sp.]|jgi:hypothetical protein